MNVPRKTSVWGKKKKKKKKFSIFFFSFSLLPAFFALIFPKECEGGELAGRARRSSLTISLRHISCSWHRHKSCGSWPSWSIQSCFSTQQSSFTPSVYEDLVSKIRTKWGKFGAGVYFNQKCPPLVDIRLPYFTNSLVHSSPIIYTNWRWETKQSSTLFSNVIRLRETRIFHKRLPKFSFGARSDFAASTNFFWEKAFWMISYYICSTNYPVPGLSNHFRCCAVAIVAEVKTTSSAKNQWSSLAYLQIMERLSISREATCVCDKNICKYLRLRN